MDLYKRILKMAGVAVAVAAGLFVVFEAAARITLMTLAGPKTLAKYASVEQLARHPKVDINRLHRLSWAPHTGVRPAVNFRKGPNRHNNRCTGRID